MYRHLLVPLDDSMLAVETVIRQSVRRRPSAPKSPSSTCRQTTAHRVWLARARHVAGCFNEHSPAKRARSWRRPKWSRG